MAGRNVGDIITVSFGYDASLGKLSAACWYTSENGGAWVNRAYVNLVGSGSFSVTGIDYNDSLCVRMQLEDFGEFGFLADMTVCLNNPPAVFTSGSGSISRTIPYTCTVTLGL